MPKVLVVDDDQDMRDLIELVLRRSELDVVAVGSPLAALDLVPDTPFDLAVLDWSMPQMDGGELCARLRQVPELEGLPILILTAFADSATRDRAFAAGATEFMSKPFTLKDLRGIVARLLGQAS